MSKPFPKRLELQDLVKEFQAKLGGDWDKYHESLSLFLVGKLSRAELVSQITPILKGGLVKYHNKLLLLNFVSSLQNGPLAYQRKRTKERLFDRANMKSSSRISWAFLCEKDAE